MEKKLMLTERVRKKRRVREKNGDRDDAKRINGKLNQPPY